MKKILVFSISALCFSTAVLGQTKSKTKTVVIKTTINCDHCKQCESCGSRLETALYDIKGVKRVDIDPAKMEIKVAYNTQKLDLDKIKQTIAETGYNADDVIATPEAVAKLDDCCKSEK